MHAVAVAEDSGHVLYVEPANWVAKYLVPMFDLETLFQEFSCVRLRAGARDSVKVTMGQAYFLEFPAGVPTDVIEKVLRTIPIGNRKGYQRGLAFRISGYQAYMACFKHINASYKTDAFRTLGRVFDMTESEISHAATKSPILPAELGYVAIHLRWMDGLCHAKIQRPEFLGADPRFCDMEPDLIRQIIIQYGASGKPLLLFGDNAPQSRRAAERLVTDLGLRNSTGNMYDLQGTTTLQHDKLIGMFSALFIGNTISTFSGVIAYTRVSLGRDPDTNIGLLI